MPLTDYSYRIIPERRESSQSPREQKGQRGLKTAVEAQPFLETCVAHREAAQAGPHPGVFTGGSRELRGQGLSQVSVAFAPG